MYQRGQAEISSMEKQISLEIKLMEKIIVVKLN